MDVDAKNKWLDKNERVIGVLCQIIGTPLMNGVESLNPDKEAWEYLKKKMHQGGICKIYIYYISSIYLIHAYMHSIYALFALRHLK